MKNILHCVLSLLIVVVLLFVPLQIYAESEPVAVSVYSSPVIITELQTGGGTASDEFIELYNASANAVDIEGWQLRYVNAGSTTHDTTLIATISSGLGSTILRPGGYIVLHTKTVILAPGLRDQLYSAKLSAADKAVGLFAPDSQTCALKAKDVVSWGTSTDGEGIATEATGNSDRLLQRYRNASGAYVDTDNNNYDTKVVPAARDMAKQGLSQGATPGADNMEIVSATANPPAHGAGSTLTPLPIEGCELPQQNPPVDTGSGLEPPDSPPPATIEPEVQPPVEQIPTAPALPAADQGLRSPQITEVMPNPAKPQTDVADEFIELYNSNSVEFDLSGFILQAGKRKYVFPENTMLEPNAFKAFFSAETHISLSNTTGQVFLLDPPGNVIDQTDSYASAKDGQAWALADGKWLWTTSPTPNAMNVIKAPAVKEKAKAKTKVASSKSPVVKGASVARASTHSSTNPPTPRPLAKDEQRGPLHSGVLALIGIFALLYGAYEYRHDVANKLHQFRLYRTARREARQSAKRR